MPKQRITKEMVVEAAFELARRGGLERVTVKGIAEKLGCSVQPIYSYCENMEGLRNDVAERARRFLREYVEARADRGDLFRSTGRAYLQAAKEEPHIFRMFIFQERKNISSLEEFYRAEANPLMARGIADALGIGVSEAARLHLNMLIYTVGIGTVFSVATPGIPAEEVFSQQEQAYQAFLRAL